MNSRERVLTACAFKQPDRIPCIDHFWGCDESWWERLGPRETLSDIAIRPAGETPFPSGARKIDERDGYVLEIDSWGRTIRRKPGGYFAETLKVALPAGADPDALEFESPLLASRFLWGEPDVESFEKKLERANERLCIFGKTGGPYLRTTNLRGETQFLMDIAADPPLAKAIAEKVANHLTAVGVEQIRRWRLQGTGIWIYDDIGTNHGPMCHPDAFERIFLPAYRRMIGAYKEAGARYVFFHSDGDVRSLLDMLVDAGIDGLNPLERRAGMDILEIRKQYPDLVLTGGMDNTDTLINGPVSRIEAEARAIIDIGRHGGVVIGTHSISPEVPLEHFAAYREVCMTYGDFQRA